MNLLRIISYKEIIIMDIFYSVLYFYILSNIIKMMIWVNAVSSEISFQNKFSFVYICAFALYTWI